MSEFKTIETQEEFDAIIKSRLDRNTKSVTDEVRKSYEGYISPDEAKKLNDQITSLTTQLTERDGTITDLTAKNKAYETASVKARIAHEKGLPYELAERLSGETEQDIAADAEKLAQFVSANCMNKFMPTPAPLYNSQGNAGGAKSGSDAAVMSLLDSLTN